MDDFFLSYCFVFVLNDLFNTKLHFHCIVLDSCFMHMSLRDLKGSITSRGSYAHTRVVQRLMSENSAVIKNSPT